MPTVVPAIRSKMGKIDFYQTTMKAQELFKSVRAAQDSDDWLKWGPEERLQRELNDKRVLNEIAPYLAQFEDRFFGAFIVLIYQGDVDWEPLGQFNVKIPAAYKSQGERMGFLTINGGELIVLDGQHRNAALGKIIQREVTGPFASEVPNDDMSVIFIKHDSSQTTRRIFNKVNRHAKPTSRGDNIITSEDDGYAIVARHLFTKEEAPFYTLPSAEGDEEKELVDWKNNALVDKSTKLTTVSVLHETARLILKTRHPPIDWSGSQRRPPQAELDAAEEWVFGFWEDLFEGVTTYTEARKDPSSIPLARAPEAKTALLHKPAAQIAIVDGLVKAIERGAKRTTCIQRLNKIDWSMNHASIWGDVLVSPSGRIITRRENVKLAGELIAYMVASEKMDDEVIAKLDADYRRMKGGEDDPSKNIELPDPITKP